MPVMPLRGLLTALLLTLCLAWLAAGATSAALAAGAAAPTAAGAAAATRASTAVRVSHAWIRWLPADVPLGGYAILENPSDVAVVLTHASSPAFGEIELHRTENIAGTLSMTPVDRLKLAPHETLDLEAHGYHLMLMQPKRALAAGERVAITLSFADGGAVTAEFEVRKE